MTHPLAAHVAFVAGQLTIMDRATSTRSLWRPYDEQVALWDLLAHHRELIVSKPRKVGATTAGLLWDVLETDAADVDGNRFVCVVGIDTDDKAKELAEIASDFCRQLGRRVTTNSHQITWPNGSRIVFTSAGSHNPARSGTPHRLHLTELPFWADPRRAFGNFTSSTADKPSVLVETTFDIIGGTFPRDLWRGTARDPESGRTVEVARGYKRHFFRVEDHAAYVRDPDAITEEQWADCRDKHGFTRRDAASFWLTEALPRRCGGDFAQLMHDFPQHEPHLFAVAAGREVKITPKAAPVFDRVRIHGKDGEELIFDVYGDREGVVDYDRTSPTFGQVMATETSPLVLRRYSRMVYIAVDTRGNGRSRGVVVAGDAATGRLLGCFASDKVLHDDLANVAAAAAEYWRGLPCPDEHAAMRVQVLIENNGIGRATCTEASRIGLEHIEIDQSPVINMGQGAAQTESVLCLAAAKRAIEGGAVDDGPPELAEECDELRRDERGNLVGRKDVLMSVGMYQRRRQADGLTETEAEAYGRTMEQRMRMRLEQAILDDMRQKSRRPAWGR